MAQIILVTSFKGGVGKTTVSAGLAVRFAEIGKKVLVCDCDLESRCLDLVLGIEEQPLFNICDVVSGKCTPDNAIARDERFSASNGSLYFMPAPAFYPEAVQAENTSDIFTEEAVRKFILDLSPNYDYIIFDLPARPDMLYRRLVCRADKVLVVSLHTATSIRAAEKTAIAVRELTESTHTPDISLVVNGFRALDVKHGEKPGLFEIVNKATLPLIGVIPFDNEMVKSQETGVPLNVYKDGQLPFYKAVRNIASRLQGSQVGLLDGIRVGVKKSDLY